MSRELVLDQAFYGSFSGRDNFGILSASQGISAGEGRRIVERSGLSGRLQVENPPPPAPIYAFYPVEERFAFARTIFLGMKDRGNDYLVHVLIFPEVLLDAIRADIFLLKDFFSAKKPSPDETPARIVLPAGEASGFAEKPLLSGAAGGLAPGLLERLLSGLEAAGERTLIAQVRDLALGADLCQALFSALPPDDRKQLFFSSGCSFQVALPYRLLFVEEPDAAPAAGRYGLRGMQLGSAPDSPGAAGWLAFCREDAREPLFGVSVLRGEPWAERLRAAYEIASRKNEGLPGRDLARALLPVAVHPGNRESPLAGAIRGPVILSWLAAEAQRALEEENDREVLARARSMAKEFAEGEKLAELARKACRVDPDAGMLTAAAALWLDAAREDFPESDKDAGLWITLLSPFAQKPAAPAILSEWMAARLRSAKTPAAFFDLLCKVLFRIGPAGRTKGEPPEAGLVKQALEGVESELSFGREDFCLAWILAGREEKRLTMSPRLIADKIAGYGLLGRIPENAVETIARTASLLILRRPREVVQALEKGPTPGRPVLSALVGAAALGLYAVVDGGGGWDVVGTPPLFSCCARLARAGVKALEGAPHDRKLGAGLAHLCAQAVHLIAADQKGLVGREVKEFFLAVLTKLVAAPPPGEAHTIARAFRRAFDGIDFWPEKLGADRWAAFRKIAEGHAKEAGKIRGWLIPVEKSTEFDLKRLGGRFKA